MFLPLFPLELVVFPGEDLNLHIFEPRYKQLIGECHAEQKTFGIPAVIEGKLAAHGTEMELLEIRTTYANGEMDIVTRGLHPFRIEESVRDVPHKVYSGGTVAYLPNDSAERADIRSRLLERYAQLHKLLRTGRRLDESISGSLSYRIAHEVGMSIEDKLRVLSTPKETDRQLMIFEHLGKAIPIVQAAGETKERLSGNGHFKKTPKTDF